MFNKYKDYMPEPLSMVSEEECQIKMKPKLY